MLKVAIGLALVAGCYRSERTNDEPIRRAAPATPSALLVTTIDQAVAAKGTHVRVRGTAGHEKLGDSIQIGDARVLCVGAVIPDARLGTTVEAEGTLAVTDRYQATTNADGEVSAGTAPGTTRWVLDRCTLR